MERQLKHRSVCCRTTRLTTPPCVHTHVAIYACVVIEPASLLLHHWRYNYTLRVKMYVAACSAGGTLYSQRYYALYQVLDILLPIPLKSFARTRETSFGPPLALPTSRPASKARCALVAAHLRHTWRSWSASNARFPPLPTCLLCCVPERQSRSRESALPRPVAPNHRSTAMFVPDRPARAVMS